MNDRELTILMPCLDEAETLETCINKAQAFLARASIDGEVVIADNGSTDGSPRIAEELGARVVHVTEKGYGAALRGGIEAAEGRYVVFADADDSYDFSALDEFVSELRGGADLVMGNRFKGGISPGAMPPLHRYLGNPVLSFLGRLFFRTRIGDFHCGLRGFNRERVLDLDLRTTGMEFASEMVVRASLAGYSVREVPTTLKPDGRSRPPHLRTWNDGWRHLRFLLLYSPRWLFFWPGLLLAYFGIVVMGILARGPIAIAPDVDLDVHTLVVAGFSVLIGGQFMTVGLLARRFGARVGFIPKSGPLARFLDRLTLERVVAVGIVVALLGALGMGISVVSWASTGFGPVDYSWMLRLVVASMTLLAFGLHLCMVGFLGGLMDLPHRRS